MPKPLVAIFAHPDDETFGPAGTLAKFASERDVYILCVTSGEEGENHHQGKSDKLVHELRREEIKRASKILGVKKVFFLGFHDGELCNKNYHALANSITKKLKKLKPDTILTFEPQGISGHLDHIAVAMVTQYVFDRLDFIKTLMFYATLAKNERDTRKDYFVYFPEGYDEKDIDLIIDTSKFWEKKVRAMQEHKTQKKDMESILAHYSKLPKEEYFLVKEK